MHGGRRWLAVLALAAVVAVLGGFTVHRALSPVVLIVQTSPGAIPADGFSTTQFKIREARGRELRGLEVSSENAQRSTLRTVQETALLTF